MERIFGTFYKYRAFGPLGSETRSRPSGTILKREIYFAPPRALNDPFDCYPNFTLSGRPEERRKLIDEIAKSTATRKGARVTDKRKYSAAISDITAKLADQKARGEVFFDHINDVTGIYCMSRECDVASQWAYYADEHRGLCLEYTIRQGAGFTSVYPVTYSADRVEVDITAILRDFNTSGELLFNAVITKSSVWVNECEVRALHKPPGPFTYPEGMLTGVIFGAKAEPVDVDWLRSTADEAGMSLSYSKMVPDLQHYRLNRTSL